MQAFFQEFDFDEGGERTRLSYQGVKVGLERTLTHYVLLELSGGQPSVDSVLDQLEKRGILAVRAGSNCIRFVTSRQVSKEDVLSAPEQIELVCAM